MKTFRYMSIICIFMITLLLFGCGANESNTSNTSEEENIANTDVSGDNSIEIIRMSRDVFLDFIVNPSSQDIKTMGEDTRKHVTVGDIYARGSQRFSVQPALAEFLKKENLNTYLKKREIRADVKEVFLLDAPRVPMLAWIEADNFRGFITIEDHWGGEGHAAHYTYQLYTQDEFHAEYSGVSAKITIKGAEVSDKVAQAVLYHNYADLPVLEVLELMGATVAKKSENLADVYYNGKEYVFDAEKFSMCEKKSDRDAVFPISGISFVYKKDGILMVDSTVLSGLFQELGSPVWFEFDRDEKIVRIVLK